MPTTRTPMPVKATPLRRARERDISRGANTGTCRRYGPPSAVRVVLALAKLLAIMSMRNRSAVMPDALMANERSMRYSPSSLRNRGPEHAVAGRGDLRQRGVLQLRGRVDGHLPLDVDVVAVVAHRARGIQHHLGLDLPHRRGADRKMLGMRSHSRYAAPPQRAGQRLLEPHETAAEPRGVDVGDVVGRDLLPQDRRIHGAAEDALHPEKTAHTAHRATTPRPDALRGAASQGNSGILFYGLGFDKNRHIPSKETKKVTKRNGSGRGRRPTPRACGARTRRRSPLPAPPCRGPQTTRPPAAVPSRCAAAGRRCPRFPC